MSLKPGKPFIWYQLKYFIFCFLNFLDKGESLIDHSVKEKSAAWRTTEIEDYAEDLSYLEELEKHRFSVW